MANILDELAAYARERVERAKQEVSLERMRKVAYGLPRGNFEFEAALRKKDVSFICEVKKASPSKGIIAEDFPYLQIAKEYELAGADCISVLTEPKWFLGSDDYLREITSAVSIPVLRKDFTVDPYMIYEAKVLGAKAVLFICAILTEQEIAEYIKIADDLGMSHIVEAHDESEVMMAIRAGARVIGVNNRNLKDFTVNTENSGRLRSLIPENVLFVSESGVKSNEDIEAIRGMGADAVLIGETLMRAKNKRSKLAELKGETIIKLCGMMCEEDIKNANALRPDYVGFIFWDKSFRNLSLEVAKALRSKLDAGIVPVGVFVDEEMDKVVSLVNEGVIDVVQLHGSESEEFIAKLRTLVDRPIEIFKAFKADNPDNLVAAKSSSADVILFDPGKGNGITFAWEVLKDFDRPYILAGGLNSENISEAVSLLHPYGVDVSSGIETDKKKDKNKMEAFVKAVRG